MTTTKVNTEFIAVNAISGTIIADNAITATHIATNAISGTLVQNGGIVTTMIAANNITSTKIVTDAVLTRHIADDQVTEAKLANAINTSIAAKLPLAGGTMTGDLILGDNIKVEIGSASGGDLQLYHDGSHSYIDNNKGALFIRNNVDDDDNNNIILQAKSGEYSIICDDDGAVSLYYDNVAKLATTSTGAAVSGTALTAKTTSATANDRAGAGFTLTESSTDGSRRANMYLDADNGGFSTGDSGTYFYVEKKGGGGEVNFIQQDNADINFQTNGAHKRLTIEGGGNVGIGTSSPDYPVEIEANNLSTGLPQFVVKGKDNDLTGIGLVAYGSNASHRNWGIAANQTVAGALNIGYTANATNAPSTGNITSALMIDSSGNVLINGTSAHPLSQLVVGSGSYDGGISIYTSTSGTSRLMFADAASGGGQYDGFIAYDHTNQKMVIGTAGSGAADLTIHSGGHIGVEPTARIYLDGISDTYMEEYSANEFGITTGGSRKFALSGGNLYHTGSLNSNHNFSDERLKENIVAIPNAVDKVKTLRGVTFTRKDDGSIGTGLIAQELEKVLPEAVYDSKTIDSLENPDAEEYKAINYGNTVGLLVEAIKELSAEVEKLKG